MTDRADEPQPQRIQEVVREEARDGDPLQEGGGVRPQQPNPFARPVVPPPAPPPPQQQDKPARA